MTCPRIIRFAYMAAISSLCWSQILVHTAGRARPNRPILTTGSAGNITGTSASFTVTARPQGTGTWTYGVCWGTGSTPTTANSTTTGSLSSNSYACALSGLTGNTTYYARSYATQGGTTLYGDIVSFTTTTGAYGSNWLRGAPTSDPTNRRAYVTSISGTGSVSVYNPGTLETWTGSWMNPQAIYEHNSYLDDPTTWYSASTAEGSTWGNHAGDAGELVVDMQTQRSLARFVVFQMFSDGKTTQINFYSHPSNGNTAPTATDAAWVQRCGGNVGVGSNNTSVSTITNPTTFITTAFTTRYLKIRAYNDGTQQSGGYIELKGVKAFSQ